MPPNPHNAAAAAEAPNPRFRLRLSVLAIVLIDQGQFLDLVLTTLEGSMGKV
jgi:hypothetical protein